MNEHTHRPTFGSAIAYKDPKWALDWLEKAVKLGLSRTEIENDPDLPALGQDPRYRKILELAS